MKLALPPRASTLRIPMRVHRSPTTTTPTGTHTSSWPLTPASSSTSLTSPFVGFDLDRDPPGILLVARDFLCGAGPGEAVAASVVRVPDRDCPYQAGISNIKNTGLVSLPGSGGADYVVAELYISASDEDDDDRATLIFFRSRADSWVQKDLRCPCWNDLPANKPNDLLGLGHTP